MDDVGCLQSLIFRGIVELQKLRILICNSVPDNLGKVTKLPKVPNQGGTALCVGPFALGAGRQKAMRLSALAHLPSNPPTPSVV